MPLGDLDVDLGADDAEAVVGVLARQVELDDGAALDGDFRRGIGEALCGHPNDPWARGLGVLLARHLVRRRYLRNRNPARRIEP